MSGFYLVLFHVLPRSKYLAQLENITRDNGTDETRKSTYISSYSEMEGETSEAEHNLGVDFLAPPPQSASHLYDAFIIFYFRKVLRASSNTRKVTVS